MSKIVSTHEIELLPGVDPAAFERFIVDELIPAFRVWEGWTMQLGKADRGVREGKYAMLLEIDADARDRIAPAHNQLSEEGQRLAALVSGVVERFAAFSSTVPGTNTVYSDYVILSR